MPIYLDNAATSFPKPEAVYATMDQYNREIGAPAGRGSYSSASAVQSTIQRTRKLASDLLGVGNPDNIAFTLNCTDSLNIALHGLLQPGDHVVVSSIEHNSVTRPLNHLKRECGVDVSVVPTDSQTLIAPDAVKKAIRPNTKLVATLHASNVTGAIQPVDDIGSIAHDAGALFLLDAAQTAGCFPIDMANSPIDFLACAGHKGLLGPLGTGILAVRPGLEDAIRSFRQGGTGLSSEEPEHPTGLPDRLEAGNMNVPGLFGLAAGLEYLTARTVAKVHQQEREHLHRLWEVASAFAGLTHYGPGPSCQTGVFSLNIAGFDPHDAATILDQSFGLQARAGLHCAPGAHRELGTFQSGGTLRMSVGPFTTDDDIQTAIDALADIANAAN